MEICYGARIVHWGTLDVATDVELRNQLRRMAIHSLQLRNSFGVYGSTISAKRIKLNSLKENVVYSVCSSNFRKTSEAFCAQDASFKGRDSPVLDLLYHWDDSQECGIYHTLFLYKSSIKMKNVFEQDFIQNKKMFLFLKIVHII